MMKNTKILFSIFFIFLFFVSISSVNATSENDTQSLSDVNQLKNDLNTEESYQTTGNTHVLNSSSFKEYVTDGKFNEKVSDGDTIDIQGKLDDPKFDLNVNKAVNIISSTGDAYIDLDTKNGDDVGSYKNGMFQITSGSKGTNITGITFHNTRIWVKNTENVHIDNITDICENNIGIGVGSFSIRGNCNNITVTNSYFMTIHNGGHSNVVVAGASNCLFENNTVEAWGTEGNVGNTFYLTTYGGSTNTNITIRNNTIRNIIPKDVMMAICWGLVLEGNGHVIENNHLSGSGVVKAQYADINYGVVTEIDGIIFRNNYVEGGPELTFPGIAYNNTITAMARLGNGMKAFNNSFNSVLIYNNTVFENNTAMKVIIEGDNNTLDNNEVYSNEDYAVTISGENNTLTNNKLLGNLGYGEDAINNKTSYVSVNNSEKMPRVFFINDDNIGEYFDDYSDMMGMPTYCIKENTFDNGDILVFNLTPDSGMGIMITDEGMFGNTQKTYDLIIENTTSAIMPMFSKSLTIKNSFIYEIFMVNGGLSSLTLINSTIGNQNGFGNRFSMDDESVIMSKYNYFLQNYMNIVTATDYVPVLDSNGYILEQVASSSTILVPKFMDYKIYEEYGMSSYSLYRETIYINKQLNFVAVPTLGIIESNIHLLEGSDGTTFDGITFENDVIIESACVNFINCTFNKNVELKNNLIALEGNTFNGKITLNSSNNTVFNNNIINSEDSINIVNTRKLLFENNTVTTSAVNTIVFDDESNNNVVKNNYLVANSLVGDDSVVIGDNIVEDNTPGYDTQIIIDCDSLALLDENLEVTITINDLNNSKPVSKGYVEVYYDGYLIDIKDLVNGATYVEIPVVEYVDGSDSYPIKVWYYEGKQYNNNITTKNINVVKSNVTIILDEFTAKLNEKATITATFLNSKGNPVKDTNVTFTIGRSSFLSETSNGVATIDELVTNEWLDAGNMIIKFQNSDVYVGNITTFTLNTSKADVIVTPTVTVEGSTASINLALTDELNNNVTDGKIAITTLDGTQLASGRVNNGVYTATVTIPENYESEYLVANYTGSYYYNDLARNIKLSLMLNSTITVETNSPLYGEELVITGKLVDSKNNPISDEEVTINADGTKTVVTTDDNGNFNHTYTPVLGVNNITFTFKGNSDVYGTSMEKTVTIRDTDREMNEVLNQLDELQKENDKLQQQLNNISEQNNVTQNQLDNLTQQNKDLQDQIAALTQLIAALSAPENTTITLNEITDARYKSDVVISGSLVSRKGLALSGQSVTITVNSDEPVSVVTVNGAFEYTAVFKSLGEQRVSVAYAGSGDYLGSDASISFIVGKQDVVVTVDPIDDVAYGDNVTITGKFTDANGKAISNSNVRIFVNGKKYLARTDKTGAYSLTAKATAVGENNVTVGYGGNDNYNAYEDTITFNADKQDVIVTYNVIEDTKVGEKVTITGTFTDKNGKAIINSNVKILINGKKYYAKTDSTGFYTFTTTVTSAGINNVTVGYSGNDKYNSYEDITTFNVEAQDVIVTVNPIEEVAVGDNVTITGTFTDKYGKAIVNSNVKILINGKKYYAKTDSTGAYTFIATVTTEGINNITAAYSGSAKYNAYETSTTFIAKVE